MADERTRTTRFVGGLSREPDGRPQNLLWFGGAVLFYALTAYYLVVNGGIDLFVPLLGVVFSISGIAESLPAEHGRRTCWLRLLAVVLFGLVAALSLVELLGGPGILH